jgi:hypothetical protein
VRAIRALVLPLLSVTAFAGLICANATGAGGSPVSPAQAATLPPQLGYFAPPDGLSGAVAQVGSPAMLNSFWGWGQPFPTAFLKQAASVHAAALLTWEPKDVSLSAITSGEDDSYIDGWAAAARTAKTRVLIRFAHEMNGRWFPWGSGVDGNTPAEYVAAWRHVVTVFRDDGASNVRWVWCIATGGPQTTIASFFPGASYVNWMAMDGYNHDRNGDWRSMQTIFATDYKLLAQLSNLPIMIAETASVEDPGDITRKSGWIRTGLLTTIPTYFPRIRAVLYFDGTGSGNEYPWASSSSSMAAMKAVFKSGAYRT